MYEIVYLRVPLLVNRRHSHYSGDLKVTVYILLYTLLIELNVFVGFIL